MVNIVEGTREFVRFMRTVNRTSISQSEIDEILLRLQRHSAYGDKIRSDLWPSHYVQKYGIRVLFRIRLTGGWRLLYTVSKTREDVIVTILEVMDHTEYQNRFGY